MACKCLHIINGITTTAGSTMATLTFCKTVNSATDKQKFCIKVCADIPESLDTYTAQVLIGGNGVPLWDKYGDPLTLSELRKGVVYQGYYGATTPHIIVNAPKVMGCNCVL